jgi:hypothetical protein
MAEIVTNAVILLYPSLIERFRAVSKIKAVPVKVEVKLIYDRRSVGQSVLVSGSHLEPMTRFLFSV